MSSRVKEEGNEEMNEESKRVKIKVKGLSYWNSPHGCRESCSKLSLNTCKLFTIQKLTATYKLSLPSPRATSLLPIILPFNYAPLYY